MSVNYHRKKLHIYLVGNILIDLKFIAKYQGISAFNKKKIVVVSIPFCFCFCWYDDHHDQKQLGEEGVFLNIQVIVHHKVMPRKELEAESAECYQRHTLRLRVGTIAILYHPYTSQTHRLLPTVS